MQISNHCNSDLNRVAAFFADGERQVKAVADRHGLSYEEAVEEIEDRKLRY